MELFDLRHCKPFESKIPTIFTRVASVTESNCKYIAPLNSKLSEVSRLRNSLLTSEQGSNRLDLQAASCSSQLRNPNNAQNLKLLGQNFKCWCTTMFHFGFRTVQVKSSKSGVLTVPIIRSTFQLFLIQKLRLLIAFLMSHEASAKDY